MKYLMKVLPISLLALFLACWSTAASAQPLSPAMCTNGGPNLSPHGLVEFQPTDTGTPMLRRTLTGPDSRCNDGSPAVMYIRPALAYYSGLPLLPAAIESRKWVIFLEGGGGCGNEDDCLQRWCNLTGYDRGSKMSSDGTYDAIRAPDGLLRRDPMLNEFAGYNQVFLYYCDSSVWIGSETHLGLTSTGNSAMPGTSYDIEFNGEAILNDAITTLLAGPTQADNDPATIYYQMPLPSLRNADEIVIAGESAGSAGVRHHLDRLQDWLVNVEDIPANVYGVMDAAAAPAEWEPWISWGGPSAPTSYVDYLTNFVYPQAGVFWGAADTALDQSCLTGGFDASHNAIGSHPEICFDTSFILMNHITTPFYVRMDIDDPLIQQRYFDWGLFASNEDYWQAQANLLQQIEMGPGGLEPWPTQPGVFGPNCSRHVSVLTGTFFTHTVSPGSPSFHDLLVNWRDGVGPVSDIQPDLLPGPLYSPSICP